MFQEIHWIFLHQSLEFDYRQSEEKSLENLTWHMLV